MKAPFMQEFSTRLLEVSRVDLVMAPVSHQDDTVSFPCVLHRLHVDLGDQWTGGVYDFEGLDLIIIESGGDNLASTFSLDLVDYWMFVIDVAAGDDIPRKRGPGIVQCDLLVVNKIDLAEYVRADIEVMKRDVAQVRPDKPTVFTNCLTGDGVGQIVEHLAHHVLLE